MKKIKNLSLILIAFFMFNYIASASYWGFDYSTFTIANQSTTLLGGKIEKQLPYGIAIGAGYFISESVDVPKSYYLYDEVYVNYYGASIRKTFTLDTFIALDIIPSLFYGKGNATADTRYIYSNDDLYTGEDSDFDIIQPGIAAAISISDRLKLSSGVSYIATSGIDLENYDDDDFRGFSINFSIIYNAGSIIAGDSISGIESPFWGKTPANER